MISSPQNIQNIDADIFRKEVCSLCQICTAEDPSFCMVVFDGDKWRFFKILEYVSILRATNIKKFNKLRTFDGFVGLFCNSIPRCPNSSTICTKSVDTVVQCYSYFVNQSEDNTIDAGELFHNIDQNININTIGKTFNLPESDILFKIALKKKKRKKIKKAIKRAEKRLSAIYGQTNPIITYKRKRKKYVKPKKLITTLFSNDDDVWKAQIEGYLEN